MIDVVAMHERLEEAWRQFRIAETNELAAEIASLERALAAALEINVIWPLVTTEIGWAPFEPVQETKPS